MVHIGKPTSSFDGCSCFNSEKLPSGLGILNVPDCSEAEVILHPPHMPEYVFDGDISDTKAIQAWVLKLAETTPPSNKNPKSE